MTLELAVLSLVRLGLAYVALGVVFALAFVWRGASSIDPAAAGASLGFRALLLPGSVLFWPVLAFRWARSPGRSVPRTHRGRHRIAWALLILVMPATWWAASLARDARPTTAGPAITVPIAPGAAAPEVTVRVDAGQRVLDVAGLRYDAADPVLYLSGQPPAPGEEGWDPAEAMYLGSMPATGSASFEIPEDAAGSLVGFDLARRTVLFVEPLAR